MESSFRDWTSTARKFGEVLARFHALDSARAEGLRAAIVDLQTSADERLRQWTGKHYADLPSLPVAKGPVMVHHIPRFLSIRRGAGEDKIALLVFDGLAIDQWVQNLNSYRIEVVGLPANFLTVFAGGRTAFMPQGEQVVVHGGISVEELMVPFVLVSKVS